MEWTPFLNVALFARQTVAAEEVTVTFDVQSTGLACFANATQISDGDFKCISRGTGLLTLENQFVIIFEV